MNQRNDIETMLEMMHEPAFLAKDGVISYVNQTATGYCIPVGQTVAPLIISGAEEYAQYEQGCLYLTLSVAGHKMGASVMRIQTGDIFTLEQDAVMPQLKAMALAAMELRKPLVGAMAIAEQMLPQADEQDNQKIMQAAQMNRRLYQILRLVNNMTDAASYASEPVCRKESIEIGNFFEEILEKVAVLAEKAGMRVAFDLPREAIYTLADRDKLERAVYNMLSNAIKFADNGTTVQVKLTCRNDRLYFSVSNTHSKSGSLGNIYNRFLREPACEDPRNGIGLGMVLVRATAALHGGAVLVDQAESGMRVTMTLQVSRSQSNVLRSPALRIDYSGERDHSLMELADVLPATLYTPE